MPQVKNWVAAFSCLRQMSILMAGCIVKSPNDKKWLSLQRDRRNSYGEGPIASYLCNDNLSTPTVLFGIYEAGRLTMTQVTQGYTVEKSAQCAGRLLPCS